MRRDLDFFVKNYSDIAAVLEINQRAREKLPTIVTEKIFIGIQDNLTRWKLPWNEQWISKKEGESEICWSPSRFWDEKRQVGAYFGIENLTGGALIDAQSDSEGPNLYLYFWPEKRRGYSEQYYQAITKAFMGAQRKSRTL